MQRRVSFGNVHAVEGKQSANGVTTPVNTVEERPVPGSVADITTVESDEPCSDVLVDVQEVIANIAHARFVSKGGVRIEILAVVTTHKS